MMTFGLMISGSWLKEPMREDDQLEKFIQNIESHVENNHWHEAKREHANAKTAWNIVSKRIQYSVERETMYEISGLLSRIEGSIEGQDKNSALVEIYYFYELWANFS